MKFTISSTALSGRLQAIGRVINAKNTLPVLDCFLFEINGNQLKITASDYDTRLSTTLELIESAQDGRFAVNAKTIQDALKEIPEQPISFEIDPNTYGVKGNYQNGVFNISGQNADEYPEGVDADVNAISIDIPGSKLLASISCTLFAASDEDLRPVMNGIYFDITTTDITIVATDGRKLVCSKDVSLHGKQDSAFILPQKPATLLKTLLSKNDDDLVNIRFDEKRAVVSTRDYHINCRLIEGRYPNYKAVIPSDNPNCATLDRLALISALRRILVFSSQGTGLVKIVLVNNRLTISSEDIDLGKSATENMECDYHGIDLKIGFNGTYLIEMLNNMSCSDVILKLADPSRAGIIIPVEEEKDVNVIMLLMPTLLND